AKKTAAGTCRLTGGDPRDELRSRRRRWNAEHDGELLATAPIGAQGIRRSPGGQMTADGPLVEVLRKWILGQCRLIEDERLLQLAGTLHRQAAIMCSSQEALMQPLPRGSPPWKRGIGAEQGAGIVIDGA